jgi:hypothetical protein
MPGLTLGHLSNAPGKRSPPRVEQAVQNAAVKCKLHCKMQWSTADKLLTPLLVP